MGLILGKFISIFGVAFLGGIGFTMSIFVSDLGFMGSPEIIFQEKIGILAAHFLQDYLAIFGFAL